MKRSRMFALVAVAFVAAIALELRPLAQSVTVSRGVDSYIFDYSPADVTALGLDNVQVCLDGLAAGCQPSVAFPAGTVEASTPAGLNTYRVLIPAATPLGAHTFKIRVCNTAQSRCSTLPATNVSIVVQDPPIPQPQNPRAGQ